MGYSIGRDLLLLGVGHVSSGNECVMTSDSWRVFVSFCITISQRIVYRVVQLRRQSLAPRSGGPHQQRWVSHLHEVKVRIWKGVERTPGIRPKEWNL
jgi:hypothetical protein